VAQSLVVGEHAVIERRDALDPSGRAATRVVLAKLAAGHPEHATEL
jgi:hypothetical protein